MASAWGNSWLSYWGNSWGVRTAPDEGGGGGSSAQKKRRKKRQKVKFSDIWALKHAPDEKISQIRTITPKITPPKKVWTLEDLNLRPSIDLEQTGSDIAIMRSEMELERIEEARLEMMSREDEEALELILLALRIDESVIL